MALAQESSGTQTATLTTKHTVATPTSAKTRTFHVDVNNMATGDVLEIGCDMKVLTGGTKRQLWKVTLANAQADPTFVSIPVPSYWGCDFWIKQTTGTGRSFPWEVITLD